MTLNPDPEETIAAPVRLPIRMRQTHGDGGVELTQLHVMCPRSARCMELHHCLECPRVEGLTLVGEETVLLCHPQVAAPAQEGLPDRARTSPPASPETSPARRTSIAEIMTRDVVCVLQDLKIDVLADLLTTREISGAPVADAEGRLVGMVSKTDLVRCLRPGVLAQEQHKDVRVGEIMMPLVFTLPPETSVARAAALMATEGVHRVPVVAGDGALVGMLSTLDVMRWLAHSEGLLRAQGPLHAEEPPIAEGPPREKDAPFAV